jgi:glycosyltransferase involved in cell wall biosynthesis
MSKIEPLVSICIPAYNRAKKLEKAVKAILNSTYKNLEIIISDNASVDKTFGICTEIMASDSRVKYFRQAINFGPVNNFQFARSKASGKYFMWHCDDDFIDENYIEKCVAALENDPELIVASGIGAYYTNKGSFDHYGNIINCESPSPFFRVIKYIWYVGENSIFYGVYSESKVRDIQFPNILGVDWAWMVGVLLKGRGRIVPSIYMHREYESSTSSSISSIVTTQGLPYWNKWIPWTAVCINIASYIKRNTEEYKGHLSIKKWLEFTIILILLCVKSSLMSIAMYASKSSFVKKAYRKFIKKDVSMSCRQKYL